MKAKAKSVAAGCAETAGSAEADTSAAKKKASKHVPSEVLKTALPPEKEL